MNAADERILICGVNWIGDTLMSMPAVQALRRRHPAAAIDLLVKPAMAPLWRLSEAGVGVLELADGAGGAWRAARAARARQPQIAWVLPHSFRSALVPFLARVPERVGRSGHHRDLLLTRVAGPGGGPGRRHQACEYLDLFFPGEALPAEPPRLRLPEAAEQAAAARLAGIARPRIGLAPGAARGPAKQWPLENFAALGMHLAQAQAGSILLFGAAGEKMMCAGLAETIGSRAPVHNFAGRTSLAEWAALLRGCDVVVCNDSGGMHLAAAMGAPLVALFGLTDPEVTGPLSGRARILQDGMVRSRDIPRDSVTARRSLQAIRPDRVFEAVMESLRIGDGHG